MSLPTLIMQEGLDNISLLGSNIISNSKFIFISANGYNIYNGLILVYYKNITIDKSENILSTMHSIIESPEKLNSNFGLTASANDRYLAVGAISYDVYKGVVYIYKYIYNKWLYMQKIVNENGLPVSVFGDNIKIKINNTFVNCKVISKSSVSFLTPPLPSQEATIDLYINGDKVIDGEKNKMMIKIIVANPMLDLKWMEESFYPYRKLI